MYTLPVKNCSVNLFQEFNFMTNSFFLLQEWVTFFPRVCVHKTFIFFGGLKEKKIKFSSEHIPRTTLNGKLISWILSTTFCYIKGKEGECTVENFSRLRLFQGLLSNSSDGNFLSLNLYLKRIPDFENNYHPTIRWYVYAFPCWRQHIEEEGKKSKFLFLGESWVGILSSFTV